jgi:hypothetical protein
MYVLVSLRHRRGARRAPESLQLARSLDSAIVEAWHRQHVPWSATTPLCDARARKAVRGATAELSSLAAALREADHPDRDSLRLCRDLLCDGFSSPLYSGRADDLRREAGRLRFRVLANG